MGELAHRGLALLAQVVQVQLAAEREQQGARIRRPLVIDDAGHRGDALTLAPGLFGVAQGFRTGQHHLGIDQQMGLAAGDIVRPQVQLVAVRILATQEADLRAVRGHLGLHQGRAGQRQRTGDGIQGQFFSVGDRGRGEHQGERSKQVAHEGFRQRLGSPRPGERLGERFILTKTVPVVPGMAGILPRQACRKAGQRPAWPGRRPPLQRCPNRCLRSSSLSGLPACGFTFSRRAYARWVAGRAAIASCQRLRFGKASKSTGSVS